MTVHWIGIDSDDLPVIAVTDQVRTTEVFAIHTDVGPPAVSAPVHPVREWLSNYESDNMDSDSYELLSSLGSL